MTAAMRFVSLSILAPAILAAADIDGSWHLALIRFNERFSSARVVLKADSNKLTGTLNELKLAGTIEGNHIRLTMTRPNGSELGVLEGDLDGDRIGGTVKQGTEETRFEGRRAPAAPAKPTTHSFAPTAFHRVFSSAIAPALRIHSGDSVRTTSVDAGGTDASGVRRSLGGNPLTGPFFVEGAMPGDTLKVEFHKVRLNRPSAGSGDRIVPNALTPGYHRNAKYDDKFDSSWKLDLSASTARLAKPTERLKNFQVSLQPMVGCVGVAPPGNQSFRSGHLGPWGGNMDYNGLREGVTVYLPVYHEGALLFVGDGHALQGDGELNGDALETSMDLEFTVTLQPGASTQAPRMENAEYLMASGIANSLPEALQQATSELARWIERDYRLSPNESGIVLGTSIRYDIAEIVPQVQIVAKVRKDVLATIGK